MKEIVFVVQLMVQLNQTNVDLKYFGCRREIILVGFLHQFIDSLNSLIYIPNQDLKNVFVN